MLSSFWNEFLKSIEKNKGKTHMLVSLVKQLKPLELTENTLTLSCINQTLQSFLNKKTGEIEDEIYKFSQKKISVELIVVSQTKKKERPAPLFAFQPTIDDLFTKTGLHAKYSFDNFAVSSSNQVAFAATQAVADNLGSSYNPLFLHGGVGVGKTHLAQSVGRRILEKDLEKKVLFCPGEQFTNELIESIRAKTTPRFRKKYRYLNLLIVDDIQFIAGKQTVQEEFFHTFNSVLSSGGQIIFTSDRPPAEIKNLEDRLRSRFSGGLVVDIQPPDFELRTAILLIKAREKQIDIDIEAAKIIAEQVSDTRSLEGMLLSVYAPVLGKKDRIDLDVVDSFFSQKTKTQIRKISPQDVIKAVCSFYNIKQSHIKGPVRIDNVVLPRQIAMFILRNEMKLKLDEVAFHLKRKDHTTVLHAVEKISRLLARDPQFREEIDGIRSSLGLST